MCKANQKRCVSCQKAGHYPQSLNCKARRKPIKKCPTLNSSNSKSQPARITKKNRELIDDKINQLEMLISIQENLNLQFESHSQNSEDSIVPKDLIPFLMMYVYLNS